MFSKEFATFRCIFKESKLTYLCLESLSTYFGGKMETKCRGIGHDLFAGEEVSVQTYVSDEKIFDFALQM